MTFAVYSNPRMIVRKRVLIKESKRAQHYVRWLHRDEYIKHDLIRSESAWDHEMTYTSANRYRHNMQHLGLLDPLSPPVRLHVIVNYILDYLILFRTPVGLNASFCACWVRCCLIPIKWPGRTRLLGFSSRNRASGVGLWHYVKYTCSIFDYIRLCVAVHGQWLTAVKYLEKAVVPHWSRQRQHSY